MPPIKSRVTFTYIACNITTFDYKKGWKKYKNNVNVYKYVYVRYVDKS